MVDNMEHTYSLHGHTRSMSSLASTIVPLASEPSAMTSITVSPMDPAHSPDIPIELKIPLPLSSTCSENGDGETHAEEIQSQAEEIKSGSQSDGEKGPHEEARPVSPNTVVDGLGGVEAHTHSANVPSVSLDDLVRIVERGHYAGRSAQSVQADLDELSLSSALARRLLHSSSAAYRNMADQFRNNDHGGFAASYKACEDLVDECALEQHSRQTHDPYIGGNMLGLEALENPSKSWIQRLSGAHKEDILMFLSKIRTDRTFLSDCISRLPLSELTALTSCHQFSGSGNSVFPNYFNSQIRANGKDHRGGIFRPIVDAIREFHKNDSFFALLHGVFDGSSKQECLLRAELWSTTCARILAESKQGSEDFLITMLEAVSNFQDWKLKPKMEMYLMKLLNQGAFLLDPPQPTDFKQPVETRNAQAVVAVANFFDNALRELLQLLAGDPPQMGVPEDALNFSHAILSKIQDPRIRLRTKTLIATRWYFSSFISNVIVYPESHGIMMTCHIGDTARQRILKELTTRMQKQVVDVTSPWNHMTIVTPDTQARVGHFLGLFEPPLLESADSPVQHDDETARPAHLMISPEEIICLTNFFYSEVPLPSRSADSPYSTNPSTASSLAGSSTLTYGSMELGSTTASSLAPSISGTFATSNTVVSEISPEDSHLKDKQSAFSTLENLDLKPRPVESKVNLGQRMKLVCQKLAEMIASETDPVHRPAHEWAFFYIRQNGKELQLNPGNIDSKPREIPSLDEISPPRGIHRHDLQALREAITRLIIHHDAFRDPINDLQARTGNINDNAYLLENLFGSVMSDCDANLDYANALFWWKNIQLLGRLSFSADNSDYLNTILEVIAMDLQASIDALTKVTEQNRAWCFSLHTVQNFQKQDLYKLENARKALRVKMWYVSDVKHSAPYEDALYVTRALRAMASSSRLKQPGSISNWARHRLRNSAGHDRSAAQTLEALAAPRDHGGFSKLADEQVELTSRWLTRNSIENFCKGEERIHRFCFEVQKCVNKLAGLNLLDSPVLWSSRLFGREKLLFDARLPTSRNYDFSYKNSITNAYASNHSAFMSPQPSYSSFASPSDPYGFRSDNNTNHLSRIWNLPKASVEFNATASASKSKIHHSGITSLPSTSTAQQSSASSSHTSSYRNLPEEVINEKKSFTHQIKKFLHSLIISDLGYLLWSRGSETDVWIGLQHSNEAPPLKQSQQVSPDGVEMKGPRRTRDSNPTSSESDHSVSTFREHQRSKIASSQHKGIHSPKNATDIFVPPVSSNAQVDGSIGQSNELPFPYSDAYRVLLEKFSLSPDPYMKLQILSELEVLVLHSIDDISNTKVTTELQSPVADPHLGSGSYVNGRSLGVPRTKATSLEEVIANCTERRAGTLKLGAQRGAKRISHFNSPNLEPVNTDSIINALLAIFRNPSLRPSTLYRDLQFIAAFTPPSILDQTSQGKAFWDAGLAALALKEDLCASMITRASQITNYHISASKPAFQIPDPILANTTLRDAAQLWLITAKEGSPVAARELGLFYLTHPELLSRVTLPFSKAKEVFRPIISGDLRGGGVGGGLGGDSGGGAAGGLDALTFAVVFHWMELAANGGDRDARDFLKENGELSGGR